MFRSITLRQKDVSMYSLCLIKNYAANFKVTIPNKALRVFYLFSITGIILKKDEIATKVIELLFKE